MVCLYPIDPRGSLQANNFMDTNEKQIILRPKPEDGEFTHKRGRVRKAVG